MQAFEILRQEHLLIERVMRILSFLLIEETFHRPNFDLFLNLFYQVFARHLMKEKALFAFLCEGLSPESEIPVALLEKSEEIQYHLHNARKCLSEGRDEEFTSHIEEFILLSSRHIFQQEESVFAQEENFANRPEEKLLRVFLGYDRMIGKKTPECLIGLLEEMEQEAKYLIDSWRRDDYH